jgi:copper homeostasis protein
MNSSLLIEVCIDSLASALASQAGGANRVELCDNLLEGGTTPSAGTLAIARKHLTIDISMMIRPRGGDFCYTDVEFESMQYDIGVAKQLGANSVVIGLLNPDGTIDVEHTHTLVELARPMSVTFHRAFDVSRDPYESLEALIALGVNRVLTSGQEPSVLEGLELITELVQRAGDRIIVMPGAGFTTRNIGKIVAQCGAREVHVTGFAPLESPMQYRNARVFMGGELRPAEYTRMVTDAGRIQALRQAASS